MEEKHETSLETSPSPGLNRDTMSNVFGDDNKHEIKYQTMTWPYVAFIMITEVVAGTTFGLPQALAVVGLVPGIIVILFCGIWALYTSYILVDFKLNHPEVHNMGDAGYILLSPFKLGWLGREIFSWGSVIYATMGAGGYALLGAEGLTTLDNNRLCLMVYTAIWLIGILICALPRTYDLGLRYLSVLGCLSIGFACLVAMIGSGIDPIPNRKVEAAIPQSFPIAFLSITNAVINYAGHFMFFPLMSEMRNPIDAKKSVTALQIYATTFYVLFAVIGYCYLGSDVQNPSLLSLSNVWAKATWGLALPNILISGSLFGNTAVKIVFVRIFRNSPHLTSHTFLSWTTWIGLVLLMGCIGFVLAVGVPIFSFLAGIASAAFASWFTYGLAGAFYWHDTFYLGSRKAYLGVDRDGVRGWRALRKNWQMSLVAIFTFFGGAFICIGGFYAIVDGIVLAYRSGEVGQAFSCSP